MSRHLNHNLEIPVGSEEERGDCKMTENTPSCDLLEKYFGQTPRMEVATDESAIEVGGLEPGKVFHHNINFLGTIIEMTVAHCIALNVWSYAILVIVFNFRLPRTISTGEAAGSIVDTVDMSQTLINEKQAPVPRYLFWGKAAVVQKLYVWNFGAHKSVILSCRLGA